MNPKKKRNARYILVAAIAVVLTVLAVCLKHDMLALAYYFLLGVCILILVIFLVLMEMEAP